jgi:hypothetical protein
VSFQHPEKRTKIAHNRDARLEQNAALLGRAEPFGHFRADDSRARQDALLPANHRKLRGQVRHIHAEKFGIFRQNSSWRGNCCEGWPTKPFCLKFRESSNPKEKMGNLGITDKTSGMDHFSIALPLDGR